MVFKFNLWQVLRLRLRKLTRITGQPIILGWVLEVHPVIYLEKMVNYTYTILFHWFNSIYPFQVIYSFYLLTFCFMYFLVFSFFFFFLFFLTFLLSSVVLLGINIFKVWNPRTSILRLIIWRWYLPLLK